MTDRPLLPRRFDFRPLQREDLPLLSRWRRLQHVSQWWGEAIDLETDYFSYGEPVLYFVALLEGRPVGLVQHYHWSDFPTDAQVIGAASDEDGIDYFLGEVELLGRGLGPAMLRAFIDRLLSADPDVRGVRVDVSETNRRSWRCLEKLGFQRMREGISVAGEPGPHFVYALRPGGDPLESA